MEQTSSEVDHHIGLRLRQKRLTAAMEESRLAELLKVSVTDLRLFEKGLKRVPPPQLIAAAETFKVSIGWFFEDAPATTLNAPLTGVNADVVRFLSLPEAYPLISAFNALKTRRQRQSVVDNARGVANEGGKHAGFERAEL